MANKYSKALESISKEISIPKEKELEMNKKLDPFIEKLKNRIKKLGIDAEVFVGGSFAKGTLIRKKVYDVDIYLRFNKKYSDEVLIKFSKKILKKFKGISKVKGSREYFRAKINSWLYFEIIPVSLVKNPSEAKNITDLSYSHVNYIKKKIKSEKILRDIKLAKAFSQGIRTYGAESYVHGFSGYSLELLVYHHGGFIEFLRGLNKKTKEKIIIDTEKKYKNKRQIMMDLNGSKLESPVILIDPTFKRRNALAALSEETFETFKEEASKFIKSPSPDFFKPKEKNFEKIRKSLKGNQEIVFVEIKTKKQEGDVAGTKLLKFFNHLKFELSVYFEIIEKDFEYLGNKTGKGYFVLEKKKEILLEGPNPKNKKHASKFSEKHKKVFIKNDRLYTRKKIDFSAKEFLKKWSKNKRKKIKEMYISKFSIL